MTSLKIDNLFLDTTYCKYGSNFPHQKDVLSKVNQIASAYVGKKETLFIVGAYTIGKERLFFSLADTFKLKIFLQKDKMKILSCLNLTESQYDCLTESQVEGKVHVLPMNQVNMKFLQEYISKQFCIQNIIAFVPTAMMFGETKKKVYQLELKPEVNIDKSIMIYRVPYSEHSSLSELKALVTKMNPKVIIPTVGNGNKNKVEDMLKILKR